MALFNLDSILRGDTHFLMGVLEREAQKSSKAEKQNMLLNIRNLFTLWGPGLEALHLHDDFSSQCYHTTIAFVNVVMVSFLDNVIHRE